MELHVDELVTGLNCLIKLQGCLHVLKIKIIMIKAQVLSFCKSEDSILSCFSKFPQKLNRFFKALKLLKLLLKQLNLHDCFKKTQYRVYCFLHLYEQVILKMKFLSCCFYSYLIFIFQQVSQKIVIQESKRGLISSCQFSQNFTHCQSFKSTNQKYPYHLSPLRLCKVTLKTSIALYLKRNYCEVL